LALREIRFGLQGAFRLICHAIGRQKDSGNKEIAMSEITIKRAIRILLFAVCVAAFAQFSLAQEIPSDYQQVLKIVGKQGDFKANVLKVNIPRNDLKMKIADYAVPTPFGFGGWFAMEKGDGGQDVVMGDLVLTQGEVMASRSPRYTIISFGMSRACSSCTSMDMATPLISRTA
jgi:hypothetical protein